MQNSLAAKRLNRHDVATGAQRARPRKKRPRAHPRSGAFAILPLARAGAELIRPQPARLASLGALAVRLDVRQPMLALTGAAQLLGPMAGTDDRRPAIDARERLPDAPAPAVAILIVNRATTRHAAVNLIGSRRRERFRTPFANFVEWQCVWRRWSRRANNRCGRPFWVGSPYRKLDKF